MSPHSRRGRGAQSARKPGGHVDSTSSGHKPGSQTPATRPAPAAKPSADTDLKAQQGGTPAAQGAKPAAQPARGSTPASRTATQAPKAASELPDPQADSDAAEQDELDEEQPVVKSRAETRAEARAEARGQADSQSRAEARRARAAAPKKKRHHGLAYRWVVNVAPIFAAFFFLLGAVWVYTEYIKPPTPQKQWQTIQNQWVPAREKDRAALATAATASPFDLTAYKTAAKAYSGDIQGWADAVKKVSDWGAAKADVATFQQVATQLVGDLATIDKATGVADIAAIEDQLQADDQQFQSGVLAVAKDLGLVLPAASPSPILFPSYSPPPSASPGASDSPAASPSAAAS